jgi:cystathionine beta-synthase
MFNDYWMLEGGYVKLPRTGDLRDLVVRRFRDGGVISVGPDDSLLTAYSRMRTADISQVPVLDSGGPVGILDESDLLMAVGEDEERFSLPVRSAMTTRLETLPPSATIHSVYDILNQGLVALIMDGEEFVGLITRTDLLNYMRRRLK